MRIFLSVLVMSALAASPGTARSVQYDATGLSESVSGPPTAIIDADIGLTAANGIYRPRDAGVQFATLSTIARVDPEAFMDVDLAEASAELAFSLSNVSDHDILVKLGLRYTWNLSSVPFDANATGGFRLRTSPQSSLLSVRSVGDGLADNLITETQLFTRFILLAPGETAERSLQAFSEALAAASFETRFEANAAAQAEILLLGIGKGSTLPIPLPAGLPLMLTALGAFAVLRRRLV